MTTYRVLTGLADELIDPALPAEPLAGLNGWLQGALAVEPDDAAIDGDLTKRGPVTRWIGYAFGNPRILPSEASEILPLQAGEPNPFFQIFDSISKTSQTHYGDGTTSYTDAGPVTRDIWKTVPYCVALVLSGGDAFDFPIWFEIDDPTASVPVGLPGSEDGEGSQLPWNRWHETTHPIVQLGEKWYKAGVKSSQGTPLDASQWVPLYLSGAVVPRSESEYLAIQAENSEPV